MIEYAYIHIPFCVRKCNYCSFVSGLDTSLKKRYLKSLFIEIKTKYKNDKLKTLYIGGGTPSLLNSGELNEIISCFKFQANPEITIEANPETVNYVKFKNFYNAGVNRISLGIQSFNNKLLKILGRNHTKKCIYNALDIIKKTNFKNINIDLMYGLPEQNLNLLKSDLKQAVSLDIQHISIYGLKIEKESFFGKYPPDNLPTDDKQADMFLYLCDFLEENNFIHYEISNFSKQNFHSIHNNSYWKNKNYYGFGLNASEYIDKTRSRNTSNFNEYIINPLKKEEQIQLIDSSILEDEIFLALRLKDGININQINNKFKINFEEKYKYIIQKYKKLNLVKCENNHFSLTKNGILLSNEIMSEFIEI